MAEDVLEFVHLNSRCGGFRGAPRAVALDRVEIFVGPDDHVTDQRDEADAQCGQAVFHFWGDLGIHFPGDQAIGLEVADGRRQHLLRDVTDGLAQFVEAHYLVLAKLEKDQSRPFVADPVEYLSYGAILSGVYFFQLFLHGIVLTVNNSFFCVTGLPGCAFLGGTGIPPTFDSPKVT